VSSALGAHDVDVGQELHVQGDLAGSVAGGAAQATGVVREVACPVPQLTGFGGRGRSSRTPLYVATVERTLTPIGEASTRWTRLMPAGETERTCRGRSAPSALARRAGTRLSRPRVVLPDPDTPVTAVSRPRGIRAVVRLRRARLRGSECAHTGRRWLLCGSEKNAVIAQEGDRPLVAVAPLDLLAGAAWAQ
jgi:hypothetical protein